MSKILNIIPVYNAEKYLHGAIEGILQQTYTNFELVIIDDCSTDNSYQIAKQYENHPKVTLLQNKENRGCYYSINQGLHQFKDKEWDYFTLHGADDISDIKRLHHFVDVFKQDQNITGIKSTSIEYDSKTNKPMIRNGKYSIYTGEGTAFYHRKVFTEIGYFDNTRFSGDTDYMWRLEAICTTKKPEWRVEVSKEILYVNYSHNNNLTKKYDYEVTRPRYWQKIRGEIYNKMVPANNFYREIFK